MNSKDDINSLYISEETTKGFKALLDLVYTLLIGYVMDKWGFCSPTDELKECIEREEWFKGVVLTTTFFEALGKRILVDSLKEKVKPNKLDNWKLDQIIIALFALKIIDQRTYSKMMKIKKFRNNIVHLDPLIKPKISSDEAKKTINAGIECIEILFEKWSENEENLIGLLNEYSKKHTTKPTKISQITELDEHE